MLDERDYPALFGTTQADWAPIDPTCAIRVPLTARTAGYRWWCPSGEWCGRAAFMLAASPPKSGGHAQACVGFGPSCQPLGSEIPTSCCGLVVLVNETAETAPPRRRTAVAATGTTRTGDPISITRGGRSSRLRCGRSLF